MLATSCKFYTTRHIFLPYINYASKVRCTANIFLDKYKMKTSNSLVWCNRSCHSCISISLNYTIHIGLYNNSYNTRIEKDMFKVRVPLNSDSTIKVTETNAGLTKYLQFRAWKVYRTLCKTILEKTVEMKSNIHKIFLMKWQKKVKHLK